MMEQVFQIVALCLIASLLALVMRRGNAEMGLLIFLAAAVIALVFLLNGLREIFHFLDELEARCGMPPELFLPLYKTIGIALIVRIGGNLCKDAGGEALHAVIETAGTVCVLLVSLPLLQAVLKLLLGLME